MIWNAHNESSIFQFLKIQKQKNENVYSYNGISAHTPVQNQRCNSVCSLFEQFCTLDTVFFFHKCMCLVIFLPFHIWFDIKTSPKIKYLQILYYGNASLLPFSLKTAIYILNKKCMLLWRCSCNSFGCSGPILGILWGGLCEFFWVFQSAVPAQLY